MPDAAETVRTVHAGGFIELLVDTGDARDIDDRAPADSLPGAPEEHLQPGVVRDLQVVGVRTGLVQHIGEETVDKSVRGEDTDRDGVDQDPGDEIGDGGQRLRGPLEFGGTDFRQQHGEGDGQPRGEDAQAGHDERIPQDAHQVGDGGRIGEERSEPLQADEVVRPDGAAGLVVKEREAPAPDGQVGKDEG